MKWLGLLDLTRIQLGLKAASRAVCLGLALLVSASAWAQGGIFSLPSNAPTAVQRGFTGTGVPPVAPAQPAPSVQQPSSSSSGSLGSMPILQGSVAGALPALPPELTPEQRALASRYVSQYKMGSGDVVTIRVFGEDDLSREKIRITDSGTIFVPAIGEMSVLGLKIGEIEKLVADGLRGRILVNPQVSVFVEEYRPFFINGKVTRPGGYPYIPGLTVRKAAALAGGFLDRASLSKIFVIRAEDAAQASVKIDLNELVFPGDIVTVEESFF
jgi:protein involved in polysaccharide export with SLBB domain